MSDDRPTIAAEDGQGRADPTGGREAPKPSNYVLAPNLDYEPEPDHKPGQPWELKKAAKFLGVHPRTITRAAGMRKVRVIAFGRKKMVPDSEVKRLAEHGLK